MQSFHTWLKIWTELPLLTADYHNIDDIYIYIYMMTEFRGEESKIGSNYNVAHLFYLSWLHWSIFSTAINSLNKYFKKQFSAAFR